MKVVFATFLQILFFCASANACVLSKNFLDNSDPTMDCSADIKDFAERASECVHWAGEDAYDKDRAGQISKAIKSLRCDKIEKDGKKLLKTYDSQPEKQSIIESIIKHHVDG